MNALEVTVAEKSTGAAAPGTLQRVDGKKRASQVASPASAGSPVLSGLFPSPQERNRRCKSNVEGAFNPLLDTFTTVRFKSAAVISEAGGKSSVAKRISARLLFVPPSSPTAPAARLVPPRL